MTTKAGIRDIGPDDGLPKSKESANCPPPIADVLTYTSVQSGCDLAEGHFG